MNPTIDFSQLPLKDIHLPGAIPWWPPAPGWWLLVALAMAALAAAGLRYYRRRHRRIALRALKRVRLELEQGAEPVGCLQHVSSVLRRFVMTVTASDARDGSGDVAGLIGRRWLAFLDSRWDRDAFSRGPGRILIAAPYARPESVDRQGALELTALCADWVKTQKLRAGVPASAEV
jgi:hypothetical protein